MRRPKTFSTGRRRLLLGSGVALGSAALTGVRAQPLAPWSQVEAAASGQTVYFNAWGGAEPINAYIQWAGAQVLERWGVRVEHVKVTDTADVVKRVRNEKLAGRSQGSVDLVWINGENFLTMKREGLLFGPFAEKLPSYAFVDTRGKPTTRIDFSEPVEGMEAPWGMAQLTFMADSRKVASPPLNVNELLSFARAHPGRVSYPRPPDFHGTTFVKQLLVDLSSERSALYRPVQMASFAELTAALWAYLDALHPHLWRAGKQFPHTAAAMRQMLGDGELLLALTFNPNDAANEIAANRLAASVVSYQFTNGTLGNTHFVAIPFNARAREGAQVLANFLLSAPAQARKADIAVWGDPTVLAMDALAPAERALFSASARAGQVQKSAPVIAEPHASWVGALEKEWTRRYGV